MKLIYTFTIVLISCAIPQQYLQAMNLTPAQEKQLLQETLQKEQLRLDLKKQAFILAKAKAENTLVIYQPNMSKYMTTAFDKHNFNLVYGNKK